MNGISGSETAKTMDIAISGIGSAPTMSSREIAELTGKRMTM